MINNPPTHGFKWRNEEDFTHKKIEEIVKKEEKGHLLEDDVKHPKELHENHNELPFLVAKMKIRRVEKLVPNLKDKKRSKHWIKH